MSDSLKQLVQVLPKAELHMHVEGSLEPAMMLELARRNNISLPYPDLPAIREAYRFNCLQDFLDVYYLGMSVLQTEQDFHDLTWAYLEHCQQDNVVHTEIFFDPQGHTSRGVEFATVIRGICSALDRARDAYGISSHLILCFLRHLDQADAFETLKQAEPWLDNIVGVGLDSSELGHPPSKFSDVFAQAAELGLKRVAHAGEEGPPGYVYEALDVLCVDRIDHGNRAMEDSILVRRLAESRMSLTVCPLSNLRLAVIDHMEHHPIPAMLDAGLHACVNSDDPAYFGGYVNDNFNALIDAVDLPRDAIIQLVKNSFSGAFLGEDDQRGFMARVDQAAAQQAD